MMENIYLKGYKKEWHSEKTDLNAYFQTYINACNNVFQKGMSLKNILNAVAPCKRSLNNSEMMKLNNITKICELKINNAIMKRTNKSNRTDNNLTEAKNKNLKTILSRRNVKIRLSKQSNYKDHKQTSSIKPVNTTSKNKNLLDKIGITDRIEPLNMSVGGEVTPTEDIIDFNALANNDVQMRIPEETQPCTNSVETSFGFSEFKERENSRGSKYKDSVLTSRNKLLLGAPYRSNTSKRNNIIKRNNFVVSFRVHEPFKNMEDCKTEHYYQQEILVMGNQTLEKLRDKIICQSDFQDTRGDISEDPDTPITCMARDVYKSAMFYIDNSFYIDSRYKDHEDYSLVIKSWARPRGIALGPTRHMHEKTVGKLNVRFGYPYLFMHQGCCEHLIIVNDARLMTSKDSLCSLDYPLLSCIPRTIANYCMVCRLSYAWWVVTQNNRLVYDTTFMCKSCFKNFNYIEKKKCGHFKAYRYCSKNMLL